MVISVTWSGLPKFEYKSFEVNEEVYNVVSGGLLEFSNNIATVIAQETVEGKTYDDYLNVDSVITLKGCKLEESMNDVKAGEKFQFVRIGYFVKDSKYPNTFNKIVGLKDSFPKK